MKKGFLNKANLSKIIFGILLTFMSTSAFSQQRKLEITDIESGKVKYIYENKRVVLKTISGEKYKGKMFFADENSIQIKKDTISIDEIFSIKRSPLGKNIVRIVMLSTTILLFTTGLVVLATASASSWDALGGAVLMMGAVVIPFPPYLILELSGKNYKNKDYSYRIILE